MSFKLSPLIQVECSVLKNLLAEVREFNFKETSDSEHLLLSAGQIEGEVTTYMLYST